jgi:hypothetical protein
MLALGRESDWFIKLRLYEKNRSAAVEKLR